MYRITKVFISGILEGLKVEELTTREFKVGWVCEKPIGGSPYRIIACVRVN